MNGTAALQISVTSNSGVEFEQISITEGVQAWSDQDHKLSGIPAHLLGGTLLRCPHQALHPDSSISLTVDSDVRFYVIVEVMRSDNMEARDGGLLRTLSVSPQWINEVEAPDWCDQKSTMCMFSTLLQRDSPLALPRVTEKGPVLLFVVVPVASGCFAVAIACNTRANYERMAVVEEGVIAWRDRDHRFVSVPPFLLGGILFQGPYKDVPEGTIVTVRPNARARVYVVLERSSSGGLTQALPELGWVAEASAPRWHEMPTMLTFSHNCAAGSAVTLPATRGSLAVFSIVVVPAQGTPAAPLEVSCCTPGAQVASVLGLDLVPLAEGAPAWSDADFRLSRVPSWMLGATLVRGPHQGIPVGAVLSVRAAAPSVVYVIVEKTWGNVPGRSGGLLPNLLTENGWEPRDEAPEWSEGSTLVIYAKRAKSRDALCLPPFGASGAVVAVVAKVDMEAFDASVVTSQGLELGSTPMRETAPVWTDKAYVYTWMPNFTKGGTLFRGPFESTPSGTSVSIIASGAFRAYVIVETEYKGGKTRNGGWVESLTKAGWQIENQAPSWGDNNSVMCTYSLKASTGEELVLPDTVGSVVFSIVVVNLASGTERLAEEMKRAFKAWDTQSQGGIRKEDLVKILSALCPGTDAGSRDALLAQIDKNGSGKINYEEFVDKVLLTVSS